MARTTPIVDKLLTNVSNGYFPTGYIAGQVFPELPVKQKTGILGAYGADHIRIVDDLIGGRAEAKRVDAITPKADSFYHVLSHALEDVVTQDDYDNFEEPFDAESDKTMGLTSLILTNKEKALATTLFDSSVITQGETLTGTDKFSDYENSKPLEVIRDVQNEILDGCGLMANAAVMSQKVFNTLKYHPAILQKLGFAQNRAGTLTRAEIAHALDVEERYLFVGNVAYNASKKGQVDNFQQLWGNSIALFVRPDVAQKRQVTLGYMTKMTGRPTRQVYQYPLNNPPGSKGIIVQDDYSFELVNTKAAGLINGAI